MKKRIYWYLGICALLGGLTGCAKVETASPKTPISLTVWHYYNGAQQAAFDELLSEFNAGEGTEKGIYVQGCSMGSVEDLERAITDSAAEKVGSQEMPDLFSTYADTAYAVQKQGHRLQSYRHWRGWQRQPDVIITGRMSRRRIFRMMERHSMATMPCPIILLSV